MILGIWKYSCSLKACKYVFWWSAQMFEWIQWETLNTHVLEDVHICSNEFDEKLQMFFLVVHICSWKTCTHVWMALDEKHTCSWRRAHMFLEDVHTCFWKACTYVFVFIFYFIWYQILCIIVRFLVCHKSKMSRV